jgi:hypothetical protein
MLAINNAGVIISETLKIFKYYIDYPGFYLSKINTVCLQFLFPCVICNRRYGILSQMKYAIQNFVDTWNPEGYQGQKVNYFNSDLIGHILKIWYSVIKIKMCGRKKHVTQTVV